MPTYGYQCNSCGHIFEVFQKITDQPIAECEKCRGEVKRLLYPVGIVFKGSGFHINDYRKPGKKDDTAKVEKEPSTKTETPAKTAETSKA